MRQVSSDDLDKLGIPWCYRADALRCAHTGQPFVINLDDKGSAGTHWTAACLHDDVLYYADPFGVVLNGYPPAELDSLTNRVVNRVTFQHPRSQLCGYFSINFVRAMRTLGTKRLTQDGFERLLMRFI